MRPTVTPHRLAAVRTASGRRASATLVGSRLPLAYARETGANLLTAGALDAAFVLDLGDGTQGIVAVDIKYHERTWSRGRYVVVHPAGNSDFVDACTRYAGLLEERSTFSTMTLEKVLDADVLPAQANVAVRDRYLPA